MGFGAVCPDRCAAITASSEERIVNFFLQRREIACDHQINHLRLSRCDRRGPSNRRAIGYARYLTTEAYMLKPQPDILEHDLDAAGRAGFRRRQTAEKRHRIVFTNLATSVDLHGPEGQVQNLTVRPARRRKVLAGKLLPMEISSPS